MQSRDTVVAVFEDRDDAQDAINALRDAGFMADDISILARDRDTAGRLAEDTGTEAAAGAATGAIAGGLLGGVAGWLIGIGALAIPGVGPIIAAGPIAAALGGAALGAAGGGIIGALTGAGVPEDEAKYYDEEFRRGGIVVTVQARGRYDEARSIMHDHAGKDSSVGRTTFSSWNETSPRFRSTYEQRYGNSRRWDEVEPAHQFGYESYGRAKESGTRTDWRTAEPTLRQEWSGTGRSADFDTQRSDIRRGWDYGRGRTNFRDYDRDDDTGTEGQNTAATGGGALAGAVGGGAVGAAVGGPLGAAGGAVIGGTAGAMAGDSAVKTPREKADDRADERRDRAEDRRERLDDRRR